MIAPRFVPIACVLVALAIVPTWIHSYAGVIATDHLTATNIPTLLGSYHGVPTSRNTNWGSRRFDSHDWMERSYSDGTRPVTLTVVRSYDAKTLYHHPELAVADGVSFQRAQVEPLAGRPAIPVHVLRPAEGVQATAIYVLHYDGRFIGDPIWFQIRSAGELLVSPRRPMTLFFAMEAEPRSDAPLDTLAATRVLTAAIDAFLEQTPPPAAGD